jgi:hypothetical protein
MNIGGSLMSVKHLDSSHLRSWLLIGSRCLPVPLATVFFQGFSGPSELVLTLFRLFAYRSRPLAPVLGACALISCRRCRRLVQKGTRHETGRCCRCHGRDRSCVRLLATVLRPSVCGTGLQPGAGHWGAADLCSRTRRPARAHLSAGARLSASAGLSAADDPAALPAVPASLSARLSTVLLNTSRGMRLNAILWGFA